MLLPRAYDLAFVLALTLQAWGEALGLYDSITWFDNVVHFTLPFFAAPTLYIVLARIDLVPDPKDGTHLRHYVGMWVVAFAFGVAVGGLWEIFEYASDSWLGSSLQIDNTDTIGDLIADSLGAAAGAALLVCWARWGWGSVRRIPGENRYEDDRGGSGLSRERLIDELSTHIADRRVLAAIAAVPRDLFVPPTSAREAWANTSLPIGHGQTISQPSVVARMCELLALDGDEHVLDVGTGSGYHAAVLARLARDVVSIERLAALSRAAARALAAAGVGNVELVVGDGSRGYPERAPYDAINVAAGSRHGVPRRARRAARRRRPARAAGRRRPPAADAGAAPRRSRPAGGARRRALRPARDRASAPAGPDALRSGPCALPSRSTSTCRTSTTPASAPDRLFEKLAEIARTAEESGFSSITVMDHLHQIRGRRPAHELHARGQHDPRRARGADVARQPRAARRRRHVPQPGADGEDHDDARRHLRRPRVPRLGAAWFEEEHDAYGIAFPPLRERFERLEDALRIARAMFTQPESSVEGKHHSTSNVAQHPAAAARRHPDPGRRQRRAQDAAAASPSTPTAATSSATSSACEHLMGVLQRHCDDVGRDPAEITKTRNGVVFCAPTHEEAQRKLDAAIERGLPEERARSVGDRRRPRRRSASRRRRSSTPASTGSRSRSPTCTTSTRSRSSGGRSAPLLNP